MDNLNDLKIKLIQKVCKSENFYLLSSFLKNLENQSINIVNEPNLLYKNENPMTDEEVEQYFKEEEFVLSPAMKKMIESGIDDVKNGKIYTEEEIDKMDEEWLK